MFTRERTMEAKTSTIRGFKTIRTIPKPTLSGLCSQSRQESPGAYRNLAVVVFRAGGGNSTPAASFVTHLISARFSRTPGEARLPQVRRVALGVLQSVGHFDSSSEHFPSQAGNASGKTAITNSPISGFLHALGPAMLSVGTIN